MRFILLFVFVVTAVTGLKAQQDSSKKTTLTLAALYGSNVSYYGQTTNDKLPYALVNATVRFPVGIYLSAGSYKLLNYGSGISEGDLGVGYDHDFNEKLSSGIAFTHSFFPANSPLLKAANANNINLSASYLWSWVKSSLSADYAFGKEDDVFLSLTNSKEVQLGTLFNEKNFLSTEPSFEIVAGTRHFYDTYIVEKSKRDNANRNGRNPGSGGNSNGNTTVTTTVASASFNLLSYNLKIPLTFSRAHYLAELSYQLSVLGYKAETDLKQQQSIFGFAFYYQF